MRRLALALGLAFAGCAAPANRPAPTAEVLTGIDVLEENGFAELQGLRVGLISNHTGKDRRGRSTAEALAAAPRVTLAALFSPEHGFNGTSELNKVSSMSVVLGGREIPIHSLYAGGIAGMRPKPENLKGLDAVVFDIQDIGARFYTYLATMGMAMEETAKADIPFIVLDRPNPINGVLVEGPVLDDLTLRQVTSTAYFPVPIRHGLTAGEMALFYNAELKHPKLKVIELRGWSRALWFDQTGLPWTAPSPNMPDLDAATLYPGVAVFEASNLAVGRGTPVPFRWVGAPWLDSSALLKHMKAGRLPGIAFSEQDYTPTKSVFEGKLCHGIRMKITDRDALRPLAVFRKLNEGLRRLHPADFAWRWVEAKRMAGSEDFRKIYEEDGDPARFERLFDEGAKAFETTRRPFLLYR